MLLLFGSGQGAAAPGLNLTPMLIDLLPLLHAEDYSALVYWSEGEMYQLTDEAAKRLARSMGGFVERDASTALVVGTSSYAMPARHLSTLHLSLGSLALRARSANELEALDGTWVETASATIAAWVQDQIGTETFRVYPTPASGASGNCALIFHRYPAEVTVSAAVIQAPVCVREYFTFAVLGEARGMESKAAMPEVAAWCVEMTKLLENVFRGYWGGAQ